jgi:membrane fusion protein (multidrug efflux system)
MNTRVGATSLMLAALLNSCGQRAQPQPQVTVARFVLAEPAGAAELQSRSEYIGLVRGDVETELSFKVGGVLEVIGRAGENQDWQEGARITNGEVLAQLKQEDFQSVVKSATAKFELATKEYERTDSLRKDGAVSQQEVDTSFARKQSAEADLAQAEQALKDSVLRGRYDGTILARLANPGETISAGRTVLKVADLRQMSVELGVPDRLIGQIQVDKAIAVKVSSLEGLSFTGRVSEVGAAAKEGARLFRVVIKVPNPQGLLKSGMTASVALGEGASFPAGSVLVPLSALVSSSREGAANQLAVFVVDCDSRARERVVTTDDLVRSSVVVTRGLTAGEKVVSVGASALYDGALVDARPAERF